MSEGRAESQERSYKRVIVDVGSGKAPFPLGANQRKIEANELYIALEPGARKAEAAAKVLDTQGFGQGEAQVTRAIGQNLPLKDGCADELLYSNLIGDHFIVKADEEKLEQVMGPFIEEGKRALTPDGKLMVLESYSPFTDTSMLIRVFEKHGLKLSRHLKAVEPGQKQEIAKYLFGGNEGNIRDWAYMMEFTK